MTTRSGDGEVVYFRSQDGLRLAARIFGRRRKDRLPVICLPGLSRNSRDFLAVGRHLGAEDNRLVVALDYRGRGRSDADPDWRNYTPLTEAQDVIAAATAFGLEKAVLLGTSRGGIIAMLMGALRPNLVGGVILNDIGPVLEGTGLARIKAYLAAARPMSGWNEAVAAVRQIAGASFPALMPDDWQAFAEAIYVADGRGVRPDFDRNLLKTLDAIEFTESIPVLWPQFDSLRRYPMMAIRGEHSDILSDRTLDAMAERNPDLETLVVPGQGHAPLLRDAMTLRHIEDFVVSCDPPGAHSAARAPGRPP